MRQYKLPSIGLSTRFRLSNTQSKKLFISHYEIVIAIPVPLECQFADDDPRAILPKELFQLAMLDYADFSYDHEFRALPVMIPGFPAGEAPTEGTQAIFGRIIHDTELNRIHPRPVVWVDCAVARFRPPSMRVLKASDGVYSWPGKVYQNGNEVQAKELFAGICNATARP